MRNYAPVPRKATIIRPVEVAQMPHFQPVQLHPGLAFPPVAGACALLRQLVRRLFIMRREEAA
ncbi:protein of unknown function [Nitrospira defluvii]|uniref:Uncharacterized protein n=1 Tax=Nitrospira defluvii TaxID=330214 RepID=D8P7V1_9BACT|nr:protein of unknown function [Nitrospira defluvii]